MMITPSTILVYSSLFLEVCLVGGKTNNNVFIHETLLCNCDTGRVLCRISMVFILISFKPQKGTPMMVTSMHLHSDFSSFLQRVYTMAMTEV